jgi:putative ABC transport system permease protein
LPDSSVKIRALATAYRGFPKVLNGVLVDVFVSWRNVIRHARRSLAGAAAVTFGTVALILAAGFIQWIFWAMREGTIHSGLGHIQIVRSGYLEHGTADPFKYLLPDDSPDRKLLEATTHVLGVAPRLRFTGLVSLGNSTLSFLGRGLDPDREVGAKDAMVVESGRGLSNTDPRGVLLGQGLATNLGAKVGDTVVLLVNRRNGTLNGVEAKVRGIFSTVTKAYDDMAVHVTFDLANEILESHGASMWVVYLDETSNTRSVVRTLEGHLGRGLQVIPWYDAADFYNKTVTLFSRQVLVMKVIIALVVILSISNTMMTNVMERTDEIATSMALGLRRGRVLSRFLVEGVLIGLMGGVIGVGLGYLLAAGISEIGIPMPPPPGMARGFVGQILVTAGLASNALLLAGATALVASLYPAWKASRMVIADALRHGR